jgi:hypothetical protein
VCGEVGGLGVGGLRQGRARDSHDSVRIITIFLGGCRASNCHKRTHKHKGANCCDSFFMVLAACLLRRLFFL